jgi:hypothetical protein
MFSRQLLLCFLLLSIAQIAAVCGTGGPVDDPAARRCLRYSTPDSPKKTADLLASAAAAESEIGVHPLIPKDMSLYVQNLRDAIAQPSSALGAPGFLVLFNGRQESGLNGEILYADRPPCEFGEPEPESMTSIGDVDVAVWVDDIGLDSRAVSGVRGIFSIGQTFVQVKLYWFTINMAAPDEATRLDLLRLWVRRIKDAP